MPHKYNSRSGSGLTHNLYTNSGHTDVNFDIISNIVTTTVGYASTKIRDGVSTLDTTPEDNLTIEEASLLDDLGITSTLEVIVSSSDGSVGIAQDNVYQDIQPTFTLTAPGKELQVETNNFTNIVNTSTEEIKAIREIPTDMLDSLYYNFIKPYKEQNPFYIGSIYQMTEIYTVLSQLIADTPEGEKVDTRLLIYKDLLDVMVIGRDVYTDRLRTQNEICVVRDKNKDLKQKVDDLLVELAMCNGEGIDAFCGSLGIVLRKPKPLIYAQAILNVTMAWYIYLHGYPVKPKEFAATIAYVQGLGGKQPAYDRLIELLDEKYKDNEQEFRDSASSAKTNSTKETSSTGMNSGSSGNSSGGEVSSNEPVTASSGNASDTTQSNDTCSSAENELSSAESCANSCADSSNDTSSVCNSDVDDELFDHDLDNCHKPGMPDYFDPGLKIAFVLSGRLSVKLTRASLIGVPGTTYNNKTCKRSKKKKKSRKRKSCSVSPNCTRSKKKRQNKSCKNSH